VSGDPLRRDHTIVAIGTAAGRGAIALVRMSGPRAFEIARLHLDRWPREPRRATHCRVNEGSQVLDDAVVTIYARPDSFTGEDVVEISTHGGQVVPASVARALITSGAVAALPGEFTRRAMLNGKLDLLQAEGIGELVNARSSPMQRAALFQVHGGLTRKLSAIREEFLKLEALIAYDIDFPEEDDGAVPESNITDAFESLTGSLEELLSTVSFGRLIRDGASVVIAGPPNSGKSSLFNAMLGVSRAIVTDLPGTTRDALEGMIDTGEWLLRLVDTAGLRQTDDRIEKLGIEVSERYLGDADVALACGETPEAVEQTACALRMMTTSPILSVWTKADLREDAVAPSGDYIQVSAEQRTGIEQLFAQISNVLAQSYGEHARDEPVLTTARQHSAIALALEELGRFEEARSSGGTPTTVAAVHLRTATTALEELIGAVDVEDVLAKLFSTFCIGK
jgi:tRNA modification GTPase